MLSEPEQRVLHLIECSMATSDPDLAALLAASWSRPRRGARLAHDLVFAVAVLLGMSCLFLGQVAAGLGSLLFAAMVLQTRRMRFGGVSGVTPPRGRRRPGSSH